MERLDDTTVAYVLETRRCFEDLRQIAAQLAGLLVLEACGTKDCLTEQSMLAAAEQLLGGAMETIGRAAATERARRHHEHLSNAARAIRASLTAAHQGRAIDPILIPLRTAYTQLRRAGSELPGFEMVAFEQGCCGVAPRAAQ